MSLGDEDASLFADFSETIGDFLPGGADEIVSALSDADVSGGFAPTLRVPRTTDRVVRCFVSWSQTFAFVVIPADDTGWQATLRNQYTLEWTYMTTLKLTMRRLRCVHDPTKIAMGNLCPNCVNRAKWRRACDSERALWYMYSNDVLTRDGLLRQVAVQIQPPTADELTDYVKVEAETDELRRSPSLTPFRVGTSPSVGVSPAAALSSPPALPSLPSTPADILATTIELSRVATDGIWRECPPMSLDLLEHGQAFFAQQARIQSNERFGRAVVQCFGLDMACTVGLLDSVQRTQRWLLLCRAMVSCVVDLHLYLAFYAHASSDALRLAYDEFGVTGGVFASSPAELLGFASEILVCIVPYDGPMDATAVEAARALPVGLISFV